MLSNLFANSCFKIYQRPEATRYVRLNKALNLFYLFFVNLCLTQRNISDYFNLAQSLCNKPKFGILKFTIVQFHCKLSCKFLLQTIIEILHDFVRLACKWVLDKMPDLRAHSNCLILRGHSQRTQSPLQCVPCDKELDPFQNSPHVQNMEIAEAYSES